MMDGWMLWELEFGADFFLFDEQSMINNECGGQQWLKWLYDMMVKIMKQFFSMDNIAYYKGVQYYDQ